jgi:hypothetical protein
MPLRMDVKRKLLARSDRVKCMDLHPKEPWMLVSLYNGNVHIWSHESQVGVTGGRGLRLTFSWQFEVVKISLSIFSRRWLSHLK